MFNISHRWMLFHFKNRQSILRRTIYFLILVGLKNYERNILISLFYIIKTRMVDYNLHTMI